MGLCSSKRKRLNLNSFEIHFLIGEGKYGRIYVATQKSTKQKYAIKMIPKSKLLENKMVEHAFQERNALSLISSPFVIKMKHCFQDEDNLYFVLDWINGNDLFDHLINFTTFPENITQFYAAELILALQDIHNKGFIHGDLKPENILIDPTGHICLIDFGSSISIEKIGLNGDIPVFGSYQYMAPEALKLGKPGFAVDLWSLGAILYEMVHGRPPHYAETQQQTIDNILNEELEFKPQISDQLKSLLTGLLQKKPENRLGYNGIDEIKNHPFFENINWNKVAKKETNPVLVPGPKHIFSDHKNQLEELILLSIISKKDQKFFHNFEFNPFVDDMI
ncbi:non-specific serine/threonine protein kinase [Anaeramoeba ignava]|uniref:non-specific serine/threonine protein kinase n=1 Tax=Anaeramoeba ignava TaxID=1746090 RepID=A0A9Q0LFY1_ANAIG|nr:non-specific serine/threonine protein kinase [Anaeramoeba ignava]